MDISMRKGTFSVRKATANSTEHNARITTPSYLIGLAPNTSNYYHQKIDDELFIELMKDSYKEKNKQTMQKKNIENLILETVITLKKEQGENNIKDLFEKLHEKFGGHTLLEVSIHRDEGHFIKNRIGYYPTKNILKKENDWYISSNYKIKNPKENDFDTIVDINEYEKIYNYHAHVKFSMFDLELSKTARMQKKDMSSRIKFVSEVLGLDYSPSKNRRIKKSVNQIKDEHLAVSNTKKVDQFIIKKVEKKLEDLRTEYSRLTDEYTELKCDRNRYKLNTDVLNKLLLDEEEETNRLKQLLEGVKDRYLKLNSNYNNQKDNNINLLKSLDEIKNKNNALNKKIEYLEETISSNSTIIKELDSKLNESKNDILETKEKNNFVSNQFEYDEDIGLSP
jgi:methyl-accepting chemotaxis protein